MTGYEVVLSYNPRERDAIEAIAVALRESRIRVFFDRWIVEPGTSWHDSTRQAISECRAVAVLLGPSGLGRWQRRELQLALERQTSDQGFSMVAVLLPGNYSSSDIISLSALDVSDGMPDVDPVLRHVSSWVDLRNGVDDKYQLSVLLRAIRKAPSYAEEVERPPKVFLCHAREDAARTEELYHSLRDEGLDPWYDKEDLFVGDRFEEEIIRAIEKTDFFAILLSSVSVGKSGFIQREIRAAVREYRRRPHGTAFILPVRLERIKVPKIQLDDTTDLSDLQWLDLDSNNPTTVLQLSHGIWRQWGRLREMGPHRA